MNTKILMDDYYDTFYRYLSDGIYQIFNDEFHRSKIIKSSYNYLQNFQIVLQQVPLWTNTVCEKKWEGICKLCGYECLEEYMKIVIITKMKFLIEHCMEDEKEADNMIDTFKCPSKEEFLRDVLSATARYFYQNPFLFKVSNFEETQINKQRIKSIIVENIKFTIQKYLPSKNIAKKCNPEELLRRKKTIYTSTASQCDTTESQTQLERYNVPGGFWGGPSSQPHFSYSHQQQQFHNGKNERFRELEQYQGGQQQNHPQYLQNYGLHPSLEGMGYGSNPHDSRYQGRRVAQIEGPRQAAALGATALDFNNLLQGNKGRMKSPSPEYIRNAHDQLCKRTPDHPGAAFSDTDSVSVPGDQILTNDTVGSDSLPTKSSNSPVGRGGDKLCDDIEPPFDRKIVEETRGLPRRQTVEAPRNENDLAAESPARSGDVITVSVPHHVMDKANSMATIETRENTETSDIDTEFSSRSAHAFQNNKTLSLNQLRGLDEYSKSPNASKKRHEPDPKVLSSSKIHATRHDSLENTFLRNAIEKLKGHSRTEIHHQRRPSPHNRSELNSKYRDIDSDSIGENSQESLLSVSASSPVDDKIYQTFSGRKPRYDERLKSSSMRQHSRRDHPTQAANFHRQTEKPRASASRIRESPSRSVHTTDLEESSVSTDFTSSESYRDDVGPGNEGSLQTTEQEQEQVRGSKNYSKLATKSFKRNGEEGKRRLFKL